MKKTITVLILAITFSINAQEKLFTTKALNDVLLTEEGAEIIFSDILETYKGKTILIDIWAGWCSDCIKGMPKVKKLQKKNKNVVFLFLSLDKTEENWQKAIKTFKIKGEHYYIASGWKGAFCSTIDLDWIPRYMIVNPEGEIVLYKAIKADDPQIESVLKGL
jgi:thiol-disulfide isomerase/thioredoxin